MAKGQSLKVGQTVAYDGQGRLAMRKGTRGEVKGTITSRGTTYYRVQFGDKLVPGVSINHLTPISGSTKPTPKPKGDEGGGGGTKRGGSPESGAGHVLEGREVAIDPIKTAKGIVAGFAGNPPALLALFNALLETKGSAEVLGGENRRNAWHKMSQSLIHHGVFATTLR